MQQLLEACLMLARARSSGRFYEEILNSACAIGHAPAASIHMRGKVGTVNVGRNLDAHITRADVFYDALVEALANAPLITGERLIADATQTKLPAALVTALRREKIQSLQIAHVPLADENATSLLCVYWYVARTRLASRSTALVTLAELAGALSS